MGHGGNSAQRRKDRRQIEAQVEQALIRLGAQAPASGTVQAVNVSEPEAARKLHSFSVSTPSWTAIGLLGGIFLSRFSVWVASFMGWVILVVDFAARRVFSYGWKRWLGLIGYALFWATALIVMTRFAPKGPATLDQEMDALAKRFPVLGSGTLRTRPMFESTEQISTIPPQMGGHTSISLDKVANLEWLTMGANDSQIILVLNATPLEVPNGLIITGDHAKYTFDMGESNRQHEVIVGTRKFLVTLRRINVVPLQHFGWMPKVFTFDVSEE